MTSDRYQGNIISTTPVEPDGNFATSSAPGTWSLGEAFAYVKAGLWPIPGKFLLNVEDVFSTYLYEGTSSALTITNGIDLDGEGGLTWIKARNFSSSSHALFDTERGGGSYLNSNETLGNETPFSAPLTFNSDGFTVNTQADMWNGTFYSNRYASWTFRKAPKFFDVVTYTGDGVLGRDIAHNLGCAVGTILVKRLDLAREWVVYHRSLGATKFLQLNTTDAELSQVNRWNDTEPTDAVFTVGNNAATNASGGTYVAYLFAHNDGDGDFGPDGDADIIKCGSYNGGVSVREINLGFEPQWVLIKNVAVSGANWVLVDNMRGASETNNKFIAPDTKSAEASEGPAVTFKPTGFNANGGYTWHVNDQTSASSEYIYIAIRRGTKVPESGTEVFHIRTYNGNSTGDRKIFTGFAIDANITWGRDGKPACLGARLFDGMHETSSTLVNYDSLSDWIDYDHNEGFTYKSVYLYSNTSGVPYVSHTWKRAPNFFDVVAYTGDSTSGRTVSHNLGVAPEMIWVKKRNNARDWKVYHSAVGNGIALELNAAGTGTDSSAFWNDTTPAEGSFTVGTSDTVNGSGDTFIAYLFASLDGVSKVGSYTGNGTSQTIDCGFTSGARFILVKRTDSTGDWYVWDTERGIVAGNDPYLELNTTDAEVTDTDWVDPDSSGFIVNDTTINASGGEYIFYAVA